MMLLQPGAWLGAFLHSAAGELGLPASRASTHVLHSLMLPGAQPIWNLEHDAWRKEASHALQAYA